MIDSLSETKNSVTLILALVFLFSYPGLANVSEFDSSRAQISTTSKPNENITLNIGALEGLDPSAGILPSLHFFSPRELLDFYDHTSHEKNEDDFSSEPIASIDIENTTILITAKVQYTKIHRGKTKIKADIYFPLRDNTHLGLAEKDYQRKGLLQNLSRKFSRWFRPNAPNPFPVIGHKDKGGGSGTINVNGVDRLIDFFELPIRYNPGVWPFDEDTQDRSLLAKTQIEPEQVWDPVVENLYQIIHRWQSFERKKKFGGLSVNTIDGPVKSSSPFSTEILESLNSLRFILVDEIIFLAKHFRSLRFYDSFSKSLNAIKAARAQPDNLSWPDRTSFSKVQTRVIYIPQSNHHNYILIDRSIADLPSIDQRGLILHEILRHIYEVKHNNFEERPLALDRTLQQVTALMLICQPNDYLMRHIHQLMTFGYEGASRLSSNYQKLVVSHCEPVSSQQPMPTKEL